MARKKKICDIIAFTFDNSTKHWSIFQVSFFHNLSAVNWRLSSNFSRQIFFSLSVSTKMVAPWSPLHGCHLPTFLSVIFSVPSQQASLSLGTYQTQFHMGLGLLPCAQICSFCVLPRWQQSISLQDFHISLLECAGCSLWVWLFFSTNPLVDSVWGAPWTCQILCFLHSSLIFLLWNSFSLSEPGWMGNQTSKIGLLGLVQNL